MTVTSLLAHFHSNQVDPDQIPRYERLGAVPPLVATAAMDSSDQEVLTFDDYTGTAACRSGINVVAPNQEVQRRALGEIIYVSVNPTAPLGAQIPGRLALDQQMRFRTGRRPFYATLRKFAVLPPRAVAAQMRVVEDFHRLNVFANSRYAVPGMLFLGDGRLNAQSFPGAEAFDMQARRMRARGIRMVGMTKGGLLQTVVARDVRAIRSRLSTFDPFFFPIERRHLEAAYRNDHSTHSAKTLRHGSSSSALGGVGAVRFALSISGDDAFVVEMSVCDFAAFSNLVRTRETLESYVWRQWRLDPRDKQQRPPIYSWDLLPFVCSEDWERHIVPTLEEIVWTAFTDTELGIYPRPLADIHNAIKLRRENPEIEAERLRIILDLVREGIPIEKIRTSAEGHHKWDPDEFNAWAEAS